MKKLFSIVLMGAALFVSTNANAKDYNVSDSTALFSAINEILVAGGENTINLGADITINGTINLLYAGENTIANPGKLTVKDCADNYAAHLVINLNGKTLSNGAVNGPVFSIFNGSLELAGTGKVESDGKDVIHVRGYVDDKQSYQIKEGTKAGTAVKPDAANVMWAAGDEDAPYNYSELIVGKNVTLSMNMKGVNQGERVLYVDAVRSKDSKAQTYCKATKYYGFQGNVPYSGNYKSGNSQVAMGINIEINGKLISAGNRCIQINGGNRECPFDVNGNVIDEHRNIPIITINKSAELSASDTLIYTGKDKQGNDVWESCPCIYAAGYAVWHISGNVIGQVGIYAKSGDFDIKDATIQSNSKTDYAEPEFKGSGSKGGDGCGIVFDNNQNYAQAMTAVISGNTTVIGNTGYAIQETITKGEDKIVASGGEFTITGGNFSGNDAVGCLEVDATLSGKISTGENGSITAGTFSKQEDILPLLDQVHGTITVKAGEAGDVYVVTPVGEPGEVIPSDPNNAKATDLVEMKKDTTAEISGEVENGYLKMTNGAKVVVKTGARYTVGGMALDENSSITVEPGAELVINEDGITAWSTSNIVLQANATEQGILLMNPLIDGNTNPMASLEVISEIGKNEYEEQVWSRFGIAMSVVSKLEKSTTSSIAIQQWDYAQNKWISQPGGVGGLKPFVGYAMTKVGALETVKVTFKGNLVGNNSKDLDCNAANGWNYFSNSFTGKTSVKAILNAMNLDDVDGNICLWNMAKQKYDQVTLAEINAGSVKDAQKSMNPLQTIIFKSFKSGAKVDFNYFDAVWSPAMNPALYAPARANDNNHVTIVITAANGQEDRISLTEGVEYNDEYNNGADAAKYMNANSLNAYAVVNSNKQYAVATNNLEGTMISMETVEGINYTMSFDFVNGETYAIKDMVTGKVIAMEEGNVYNFVANENAVNAGRFQVVSGRTVATGVDNINAAAVKGVYSVLGQRVGTTENYNALPAGIYVVDGVKVVKK